jgi:signal transduction histidine kinase
MKTLLLFSILFYSANSYSKDSFSYTAHYFIDSLSQKRINNFNELPKRTFYANENIQLGYVKNTAIWCVFILTNNGQKIERKALTFNNIFLDSLSFYTPHLSEILGDRTTGIGDYPFNYSHSFTLKPNETKTIIVSIKKIISFFDFSFQIKDSAQLKNETNSKTIYLSIYFGINFFMLGVYLVILILQRKKKILVYLIYAIFSSCYILITTGYLKFLIFPNITIYSELRIYSGSLWFISLLFFISHFLELKIYQPRIYRLVKISNSLNLVIIGVTISLLFIKNDAFLNLFTSIGYLNFIYAILVIVYASIVHLKKNKFAAIFLFIGLAPHFIWSTAIILRSFTFISTTVSENWLLFISLYEILFFAGLLIKDYLLHIKSNNTLSVQLIKTNEKSIQDISTTKLSERRKIASLIHDNFGSKLAYISQLVERGEMENLHQEIDDLSTDLRILSHNILPKSLEDGALFLCLKERIEQVNNGNQNTKVYLLEYDFPQTIHVETAYTMYLISIEIINNSIKHGKSTEIVLEFIAHSDALVFQFTDNGIGFEYSIEQEGFGISSIRDRIHQLEGQLEINSNSTDGTIIQITLPI